MRDFRNCATHPATLMWAMLCLLGYLVLRVAAPVPAYTAARAGQPAQDGPVPEVIGSLFKQVSGEVPHTTRQQVLETYGKLPLYFIENQGQLDARVAYYMQGRDSSVYFTAEGVTFVLTGPGEQEARDVARVHSVSYGGLVSASQATLGGEVQRWTVKLDFVDANPRARPVGEEPTSAVISYFKGPREEWKTGLPTYASLVYKDLWPGIDLVYTGTGGRLKCTFFVQPGADPNQIQMAYRGATAVRINDAEQLEVSTPLGGFEEDTPYAYQEVEGQRQEVAAAYVLTGEASHRVQYGFRLGAYDRRRPLVLDPVILIYAGYIGGSNSDYGHGIAVDATGNAYITGTTRSSEATFPVTVGPDLTRNIPGDAFVAKVNAGGTALLYAGYIGGSYEDRGLGIAVDSAGSAYVTGWTTSDEATFPVTVGPDLTYNQTFPPFLDAFIAKVNPSGTALVYAGYIGGTGNDEGHGIAVDGAGNAYITGWAEINEASFPVKVGPDLTHNGGSLDAFVAKVNPSGTALVYAGYIGGSLNENGSGIAVDSAGNAYVTGSTFSRENTFPVSVGPDLTFNGGNDAFVAKVGIAPVPPPDGTPPDGTPPDGSCVNIAGVWRVEESGTLTCTLTVQGESETFPDPISGSASVTILQAPGACTFSFNAVSSSGGTISEAVRNGQIEGNSLKFSGLVGVPVPGATLTKNILEGVGQIQGNVINASASGLLEGTVPSPEVPSIIGKISCTITTTAIFSRSAPPPFTSNSLVNGARFEAGSVAEQEIVSLFGLSLADFNADATLPLSTQLGGASVDVTDSQGITRPCLMFAARVATDGSPAQLNFMMPAGTATGPAKLTVRRASGGSHSIAINVARLAPGIFTANSSGSGVPAANVLRFVDGGLTDTSLVFDVTAFPFQATPIDLGPANHQVFLSLFATGMRNGSKVQVTIGGVPMTTIFGPAPSNEFEGLDQLNVLLERVLFGRGLVQVVVTVDGVVANVVEINIL